MFRGPEHSANSPEQQGDRETVSRVVNSGEVQSYILELHESYLGLGQDAINAIRKRFKKGRDAQLARTVLNNNGPFPRRAHGPCCCPGGLELGNPVLDVLKKGADSVTERDANETQDTGMLQHHRSL